MGTMEDFYISSSFVRTIQERQGLQEQQDHTARDHDNPAETPTPGNVQPLGEDGPGVHTEACFQHHGCGKAEQKETGKKLNKPSDGVEGTRHSSL